LFEFSCQLGGRFAEGGSVIASVDRNLPSTLPAPGIGHTEQIDHPIYAEAMGFNV
jgi:hypothetical protein